MKKRLISMLLAAIMLTAAFTACTTPATDESDSSDDTSTSSQADDDTDDTDDSGTLFAETVSFTIMGPIWEPHTQAAESMEVFDAIAAATNTDITYEFVPSDGYRDRVTTTLASQDIPEVMSSNSSLDLLISEGAAIALDDLMSEYGSNILDRVGESVTRLKNPADGKLYSLPFVLDYPPAYSMLVRQDWLDAVGIAEIPETWDEWIAAWTAFADGDPNQDGDNTNDIPYGGDIYSLMPAFGLGISGKDAFIVEDGVYTLAYESDNFTSYLEEMRYMYENDLLDKEFTTRGVYVNQKEFESALFSGIIGSTMNWAEMAKRTTEAVQVTNPDAQLVGTNAIKGPDGEGAIPARSTASTNAVITITAEANGLEDEIMQYYNWLFGEEGTLYSSYGVEGVHYEMVDGTPIINSPYSNDFVSARGAGLNFTPLPHFFDANAYEQILLAGKTVEELDEVTKLYYDALTGSKDYYDVPPVLTTEAYMEHQANILPKIETMLAQCVTGQISIDEFYTQYEALKPIGLQEILDDAKAAWDSM